MGVRELDKPVNQWCRHCRIGQGCGIYEERPQSCRTFECVWLQTQRGAKPLGRELRPDATRVVLSTTDGGETVVLNVSPDREEAWQQGAMGKLVSQMLRDGIRVLVKCGERVRAL